MLALQLRGTRAGLASVGLILGAFILSGCNSGTEHLTTAAEEVAISSPIASASIAPTPTPTPATTPTPVVAVIQQTEREEIPFAILRREDSQIDLGIETVDTEGVAGSKTLTYEITLVDGEETQRELLAEAITRSPVDQIIAVGSKEPYVAPPPPPEPPTAPTTDCDPNYSGPCVPIASDVDCAGGSGNGPAYVEGPVYVVGSDIYDLDGNVNDGVGCES